MRIAFLFLAPTIIASTMYVAWHSYVGDVYVAQLAEPVALPVSADTSVPTEAPSAAVQEHIEPEPKPKELLFVGDIFLDRYIRQMAERYGEQHTFGCIKDFLLEADTVVGNLEGPITDNASRNVGTKGNVPEHYTFTFATTTAPMLAKHNITVVNLGNNHIANFGTAGIASTKEHLTKAGISYFGGITGDEPVYRDGTLSLVSFNQFGGTSSDAVAQVVRDEVEHGQQVIVYAHWGEEYVTIPGYLRPLAEKFVAAGALAIIGSHPHVVIPPEYIDDVPVYYSLGNFMFDQYFSDDVMRGLAVRVVLEGGTVSTESYPVELKQDGTVCLADLEQ